MKIGQPREPLVGTPAASDPKAISAQANAKAGGAVAGRTRKDIEAQTGKPVITGENFKQLTARNPHKLKTRTRKG